MTALESAHRLIAFQRSVKRQMALGVADTAANKSACAGSPPPAIEMGIPRPRTLYSASGRDAAGHATRRRIFTGVGRPRGTLESVTAEPEHRGD